MFRRIISRAISGDAHGRARVPPQTHDNHDESRPMEPTTDSAESAPARDEPTDNRPQLVAHDVSESDDDPLVALYDPDGNTLDGEIMYAEATVNVGDWE